MIVGQKEFGSKNVGAKQILVQKNFAPQKSKSVTVNIFLIWTNNTLRNVAWTKKWPQKPTFKVLFKLGL